MGKFSRDKGARNERKIVNLLRDAGIDAARVPLSGSAGGRFAGDIDIHINGQQLTGEVKARSTGGGFTTILKWLGDNDLLFLVADHKPPNVLMPISIFNSLIGEKNEKEKKEEPNSC